MRTKLPESFSIDFDEYLGEYLERPEAVHALPSEEELIALAHKAIVREQLVLAPLPEAAPAAAGDTAVLRVSGAAPRYNKERVTVTLGRGLYNRRLEEALTGCRRGDTLSVDIDGGPVTATILELRRRQAPEPTDEMVQALQASTADGRQLRTVREYEDYIRQEKTMSMLAEVNYYVTSMILEALPPMDCDEEDIRVLGELERDYFVKLFLETEHIDIREGIPEAWKQDGIRTLDDFIRARRDWYILKIKQCLIFLDILGLPCEGGTDPLDHYEVLQELQLKIFDLIRSRLERR